MEFLSLDFDLDLCLNLFLLEEQKNILGRVARHQMLKLL
jgi:hypothetical protein